MFCSPFYAKSVKYVIVSEKQNTPETAYFFFPYPFVSFRNASPEQPSSKETGCVG